MSWLILLLAGLFEVVWAVGLKYSEGFTRPIPSVVTLCSMVLSFYLLSVALRDLPLGSAYAIWVGIGMVGAAIAGFFLFHEAATLQKFGSLTLILIGLVGLKLSSSAA